jgi:hypothetical protein
MYAWEEVSWSNAVRVEEEEEEEVKCNTARIQDAGSEAFLRNRTWCTMVMVARWHAAGALHQFSGSRWRGLEAFLLVDHPYRKP